MSLFPPPEPIVRLTIVHDHKTREPLWQAVEARPIDDLAKIGVRCSRWAYSPGGQLMDAKAYRRRSVVQGMLWSPYIATAK